MSGNAFARRCPAVFQSYLKITITTQTGTDQVRKLRASVQNIDVKYKLTLEFTVDSPSQDKM